MLRAEMICRTVWVKDLVTTKAQGQNGEFDSKTILFKVATRRNYTRTVMKDGQQVKETPTDFFLCRASGALAQVIADHCSAVDAEGKHISRHLYLLGHVEGFQQDRTVKIENLPLEIENIGEVDVTFDTSVKQDSYIVIVNELEFLDSKKEPSVKSANGVSVSGVKVTVSKSNTTTQTQATKAQVPSVQAKTATEQQPEMLIPTIPEDRKSTRLNSSHLN